MHCKSELDNSTLDWKQVTLRRNFSYKALCGSSVLKTVLLFSKTSFGEFQAYRMHFSDAHFTVLILKSQKPFLAADEKYDRKSLLSSSHLNKVSTTLYSIMDSTTGYHQKVLLTTFTGI